MLCVMIEMGIPISVEQRDAVTLWCLGTPYEYRTVAHLFEVVRSRVFTIVHDTCQAIIGSMLNL